MAESAQGKLLTGKVAIVTGASSGIGVAIAKRLASEGAAVAIAARRLERLEGVKKEIEDAGGKVIAVKTDTTVREDMKNLARKTEESFGAIDILVNNAGVFYITPMKNCYEDQWDNMVNVNCKGVLNGIGAVLPGMVERGRGHIVNISSDSGRWTWPGMAVYSGTKFFVEGMSQALRKEVAASGVKVTSVLIGQVSSEIFNNSTDPEAKNFYDPSETSDAMAGDDIARAVVFAVTQPQSVAVNELLVQPTSSPC